MVGRLPRLAIDLAILLLPDKLADKANIVHHKKTAPEGSRSVGSGKKLAQGNFESTRVQRERKAKGFAPVESVVEKVATVDQIEVNNWLEKQTKKKLAKLLRLSRPALYDAYKAAMRAEEVRKDTTAKAAISPIPPYRKPKPKPKGDSAGATHLRHVIGGSLTDFYAGRLATTGQLGMASYSSYDYPKS